MRYQKFRRGLAEVDRAILDGADEGYVTVLTKEASDQILGATIVARHAGEMISQLTTAIVGKVGLGRLAGVIHPYPTQAEAIKATSGAYLRTRLTPFAKGLFDRWLRFSR